MNNRTKDVIFGVSAVAIVISMLVFLGVLAHQKDVYNAAIKSAIAVDCAYYAPKTGKLTWK